ncbi:MAG: hypothetical protein N3F67_03605 [Acidilobaceae archaeon]|nr:hypothetical protein [Acidilobaceae archaeon]
MRIAKNKEIKRALIETVKENVSLEEVKEWLWEDFGVRVKSWEEAEKFMMRDEVSVSDIYVFLLENEVEIKGIEEL